MGGCMLSCHAHQQQSFNTCHIAPSNHAERLRQEEEARWLAEQIEAKRCELLAQLESADAQRMLVDRCVWALHAYMAIWPYGRSRSLRSPCPLSSSSCLEHQHPSFMDAGQSCSPSWYSCTASGRHTL